MPLAFEFSLSAVIRDHLQLMLRTHISLQMEPPRFGDVRDSLADISQSEKVLGYLPRVDLEEGLRRTVESYRASRKPGLISPVRAEQTNAS